MKPAPFTYHRPETLADALGLLAALGEEAKVLAGGQSLVPLLALRLAAPGHLVDIGRIASLGTVEPTTQGHRIGATVTDRAAEIHPDLVRGAPLLVDALPLLAHPQIRNRGTVCGSLAHADPAAELPAVAVALDATFHVASVRGTRAIAARDFFLSYLETALAPDEVLVGVELLAAPPRSGAAFQEISRRHGDFAMAGAAASLTLDAHGNVEELRLALSGMGSVPVRATAAEAAARGAVIDDALLAELGALATAGTEPPEDIHATAAYRTHVAGVLVRRAVRTAHDRALEGAS